MAIHLDKQKGDIQAGVIGIRAPDGSIIRNVKFYRHAEGTPAKEGKLTIEEKEVCEGLVSTMTDLFGQYVEGVKALERERKKVSKGKKQLKEQGDTYE